MAAVWAVLGAVFVVFLIFLDVPWNYPVVAAVVITGYVALYAKSDGLAVIRGGKICRNNAKGLLRACHIQQHKRQKSLRLWAQGRSVNDVVASSRNAIASVGVLAANVAGFVGAVTQLLS
jgi:hypothetical protein